MNTAYKWLAPAATLADLAKRIEEAIAIAGPDAEWNGFDDEAIYIHGEGEDDGDTSKWVAIPSEEEGR